MSSNVDQRTGETRSDVMDLAEGVWRRVGVRRVDRRVMLVELADEIAVAQDNGGAIDDVLGTDRAQTLREWADAQDSSGKALRLAVIVPAALAGLLVAFGTVLLLLTWATVTHDVELPMPILLTLYGTSGVIALVLAGAAVWMVLRGSGDPRAPPDGQRPGPVSTRRCRCGDRSRRRRRPAVAFPTSRDQLPTGNSRRAGRDVSRGRHRPPLGDQTRAGRMRELRWTCEQQGFLLVAGMDVQVELNPHASA